MSFIWPWLLLLLPLPWVLAWRFPVEPAGAALRLPAAGMLPSIAHRHGPTRRPGARPSAAGTAIWVLLLVAAARPIGPGAPHQGPVSGRELMLALDLSASMGTRDLRLDGRAVSRLDAARELARHFVARRDGDRIGLIVFGRQAYLHTPLTFDHTALDQSLADAAIGLAGQETALGDAIALAASRQAEFSGSSRALVLLTDGANTAGQLSPAQAGWLARRTGVRLHIVGIGAPPAPSATPSSGELDEAVLQELARQTGGSYRRATDGAGLRAFFAEIDALEPLGHLHAAVRPARELYPWPLALALAVAAIGLARRARPRRTELAA